MCRQFEFTSLYVELDAGLAVEPSALVGGRQGAGRMPPPPVGRDLRCWLVDGLQIDSPGYGRIMMLLMILDFSDGAGFIFEATWFILFVFGAFFRTSSAAVVWWLFFRFF